MDNYSLEVERLLKQHKKHGTMDYASRFKDRIIDLYRISHEGAVNEIKKLNNCKEARRLNGRADLQRLFRTYWDGFLRICERKGIILRESITENVNALISCGDVSYGYAYFDCPTCGNFAIVPFTCKSRFCPSCGYRYRSERTLEIKRKCIGVPHRHMVFTVSDRLRRFFQADRRLIDCLFEAVNMTFRNLECEFRKRKGGTVIKRTKRQFGFISTLHTFGRDLKFNPHLHVLVAEAVLENGKVRKCGYFNYRKMRKCFMYNLISLMNREVKASVRLNDEMKRDYLSVTSTIFSDYDNGFYCYLPPLQGKTVSDSGKLIEYITRYSGHPAISESRILGIDYVRGTVTYSYVPHEDTRDVDESEKEVTVTEPVYDFIARLIVHIPENGMHNIRYYGFYSNRSEGTAKARREKGSFHSRIRLSEEARELNYREMIIRSFDFDPLMCSRCGDRMAIDLEMCYIPETIKRRVRLGYG